MPITNKVTDTLKDREQNHNFSLKIVKISEQIHTHLNSTHQYRNKSRRVTLTCFATRRINPKRDILTRWQTRYNR